MDKYDGPRLHPKLGNFVNGSYPYNPILCPYGLDIRKESLGRYTNCIANMIHHPYGYMALANMIRIRARAARIMAYERKRILQWRKKHA